jgi:hypothetical protein
MRLSARRAAYRKPLAAAAANGDAAAMKTEFPSRRRAALVLAAAGWPLAACAFDLGGLLPVKGSGRVTRTEIDIPEFDSVEASGSLVMELEQGQPPHASLETDDNLATRFDVRVERGTLRVQHRGAVSPTRLRLVVKVWKLQKIAVSGGASVSAAELVTKHLALQASGSGVLRLPRLTAETLDLQGGGSSAVTLGGRANALALSIGGSALLDARMLQVRRVSASVGGSGEASVWATDALSGAIGGSGTLKYRGDPEVSASRGGSASLTHLP